MNDIIKAADEAMHANKNFSLDVDEAFKPLVEILAKVKLYASSLLFFQTVSSLSDGLKLDKYSRLINNSFDIRTWEFK
ncbi:hypothetical protein [Pluralibacter gergoviae]|uniref:hypothetical protein n=1 Tax=Pluralibacter gergoviae TaxID=61647 RepID=UPI00155E35DE|nr:hypothetical protein [Pluralibacter gergoviae]